MANYNGESGGKNRKLRYLSERNWYDTDELNRVLSRIRNYDLTDRELRVSAVSEINVITDP